MAINKNAFIRYQVLDRCFRNSGRQYFWEDLLAECNQALADLNPENSGIQRRQLYDDMRFMESDQGWSIPLGKFRDGKRVYYRYSDLTFSINNQPLNDSEIAKIKSAVQVISRFSGSPEFEWVNEMIPLLESKFGLIKEEINAISFESNIDLKGFELITPIFNAIVNERVLLISYKDFKSSEPYDIHFHPYHLKQYNNRWFVFGLNNANGSPTWNLALDRILAIQEINEDYLTTKIDWEDYFFDIIGVTRPEEKDPIDLELKFTTGVASYIITKPLHPTQKHKNTPSGLEVRIKVIPNYELESLILSFGEKVEVVSPESIRERIQTRLQLGSDRYH